MWFIIETLYLMEDKFKSFRNFFEINFVRHVFEAAIKCARIGSLCIFGIHDIIGTYLSFSSGLNRN